MNERHIIFNDEMVRAILDGRKTQTRQVIKPQPRGWSPEVESDGITWAWCIAGDQDYSERIRCPHEPGDLLLVQETLSRITLEITGVRVERVQDISKDDALAEGIKPTGDGMYWGNQRTFMTPVGAFAALWDSFNAKRGIGWDENPWVWVIEFRRVI